MHVKIVGPYLVRSLEHEGVGNLLLQPFNLGHSRGYVR